MNFRKFICTIMTAAVVGCTFASCGDTETAESSEPAAESAVAQTETADVAATADKLKSDITYDDELTELPEEKIQNIIGVSADKYTSCKIYVSASGGTPEEIDCFEAVDENAAAEIKAVLEKRIENQKKTFTDYNPEQATKLESPVLKVNGSCVYLCISGESSKAEEIIG